MNRPPCFNREGVLALLVFCGIAVTLGILFGTCVALGWDKVTGVVFGGIAAFLTILLLCSVYTGSERR